MNAGLLERLETELHDLSETEQRILLERLARRVNDRATHRIGNFAADLDDMSNDPEIRKELAAIGLEFRVTDADGLELVP